MYVVNVEGLGEDEGFGLDLDGVAWTLKPASVIFQLHPSTLRPLRVRPRDSFG